MFYKLYQVLSEQVNEVSTATHNVVVAVLGQELVDKIQQGYQATVEFINCKGQAALELFQRVLGI